MEIKIKRGKILLYRVYDIGAEIDLEKVEALFQDKSLKERFKLDRKHNTSLIISSSPVSVQLGPVEMEFIDKKVNAELIAKVWQFGTLSLCIQLPIPEGTSWKELVKMASWLDNNNDVDILAKNKAREFQRDISHAISIPGEWDMHEDYVTYFIQEFDGLTGPVSGLMDQVDVPALILGE